MLNTIVTEQLREINKSICINDYNITIIKIVKIYYERTSVKCNNMKNYNKSNTLSKYNKI